MITSVRPERASLGTLVPTEAASTAPSSPSAEAPTSPVQRLALGSDRSVHRDVSMLLALALAESTRELARDQREMARAMVEGRIAVLTSMIRLEPNVAAMIEDVQFIKTMATHGVSLATSAAPVAKAGLKKAGVKLPNFGLKDALQGIAARPGVATALGRFPAVRDRLVLANPRARYVFARNAATAELGARLQHRPELREAWLKVATARHGRQLVAEATGRQTRLDLADWPIAGGPARPVKADALAKDVFGPAPTRRQVQLVEEAAGLLASGGEPFHAGLVRRTRLMTREQLATRFERERPFYGRASDAADRAQIAAAVRDNRVDLSLPLRDPDGTPKQVPGLGVGAIASAAVKQLDGMWADGWGKDQQEMPDGLHGIADGERAILDAWHAELMASRLELVRWAGRFSDVLADVADVTMGVSDE